MTQQVPLTARARAPDRPGTGGFREVAPDIAYQRLVMVNVVFVGLPDAGDRGWVLVDTGLPGSASAIRTAAAARFGAGVRPSAIVLTHGHFDHVGAVRELASEWDVPVYAHPLEHPYLDGSAAYPPGDPAVGGGLLAALSALYPTHPVDLGSRLVALPADGSVPRLAGWTWHHTPGHAPGHVSLWREADRVLLAGDAVVTTAQESLAATALQSAEMHGPPRYFTIDWTKARDSAAVLAGLRPRLIVTGHGRAMKGDAMTEALETLARQFDRVATPRQGRYLDRPATAEDGSAYRTVVPAGGRTTGGPGARRRHKPLSEQVIVITGASSGIGLATARAAAARGARVMLASRNAEVLASVARDIRERGGEARYVVTDVSRREDLEVLAAETVRAYGGFDTWVNNAGLSVFGRLDEVSDEDHRRLFDVNFWGVVFGSTVAIRHLGNRGGALINLGSVASDLSLPLQGMYSASKHAIKGFTDALRQELLAVHAPVSVTLIKPASIDTPFPGHAANDLGRGLKLPPPIYDPGDVADAVLYAAVHGPRDVVVGGGGRLMIALGALFPRATDWVGARAMTRLQMTDDRTGPTRGALDEAGIDGEVRGTSPHHVMRSLYTRAAIHPLATGVLLAGLVLCAAASRRRPAGRG